ncbi:MAG: DUF4595 domain-containing protein [Rikenellaceae bacterium]|nr:DUF4595 domain-containing protein [Rikenellaceae bacterium]
MKKLLFFVMAASLVCSCKKDDGDDVIPENLKKVSRIEFNDGSKPYSSSFSYDAQGRVAQIDGLPVTWSGDKVTYDGKVYTLSDGRAVKAEGSDPKGSYHLSFEYDKEGYLVKTIDKDEDYECSYSIKDGNMVEIMDDGDKVTCKTSDIPNNLNIDFYSLVAEDASEAYMLGIAGKRLRNMLSEMRYDDGSYWNATSYEYKVDKDGYVTEITETYTSSEGDKYVSTIKISYME